ncbi:MAG TPA: SRPBCC family protein [Salinimicrobium sp.]|nr:SRPBCC family protein [Salinimicrobium sp.]
MDLSFSPSGSNVSKSERLVSILSGTGFLVDALIKNKKNIPEAAFAGYLLFRGISGQCFVYKAMGKTKPNNQARNINLKVTQTVARPREEVFAFWSNLENLPLFMKHLENVEKIDEEISQWEAKVPGGIWHIRWQSKIVKEIPGELIGWRSLPGSSIMNAGKIEFFDGPGGSTIVHAVISYHAPLGIAGEGAARIFNPYFEDMVRNDILSFRNFIEKRERPAELIGK